MTIHTRVAGARHRLREAGIGPEEADLDARLLAEHLLGWDAARFFTSADQLEPPDFSERYDALVARREGREPLAYITGRQEFWGLAFEVSPAVLIPRPETELVVQCALEHFPCASDPIAIADVCTGSGCLAVALAHERPFARVVASDVSMEALHVARRNTARHGAANRVRLLRADLLEGLSARFDLIVSNPPYVPEADHRSLPLEVRDHEPALALAVAGDGTAVIDRLVRAAGQALRPGGALIFEFGFGQVNTVTRLVSRADGLALVDLRHDLQGIPRTAIARRT